MSVNHTPGPYRVGPLAMNDGAVPILADDDEDTVRVALVDHQTGGKRGHLWNTPCPVRDANARLFAEAPATAAERDRLRVVNAELVAALRAISCIAGNLPDDRLESRTGANDAVARGMLVTRARMIARAAIARVEPS